jgi:hypothetical protein
MRATFAYTGLRLLFLAAALVLLYLAGARGLLLVALALVVSGVASFVLLVRQRAAMAGAISARWRGTRGWLRNIGTRLDEGARAEDDD